MNEVLVGYSVRIGGLSLNVFGLGVDLLDVAIVQTSHPDPPIAALERFGATIQWGALLSGDVVGDLVVDSPRVLLNSTQVLAEADDKKDLQDRGWQDVRLGADPLRRRCRSHR